MAKRKQAKADRYGLEAGRTVTVTGEPVFCITWAPGVQGNPAGIGPVQLDRLAHRIVKLLNESKAPTEAKELSEALTKLRDSFDGDSNDDEHDAAFEVAEAADALLAALGISDEPEEAEDAGRTYDASGNVAIDWNQREKITARLEYLRGELRKERISYGEIAELQSLAPHIAPDDVELLQAAGIEESAVSISPRWKLVDQDHTFEFDGVRVFSARWPTQRGSYTPERVLELLNQITITPEEHKARNTHNT